MEIRVHRLDGGHVCLRRAHTGAPLARQSLADRAPSQVRRIAPLFQRGFLDSTTATRSSDTVAACVFPALPPPPSIAAGVKIMLSFGIQGG